jgi:hypothetical protein
MFEDIVKERPDIREKLKAVFEEDFRYMREEVEIEPENEEALKFLTDRLESEIDTFIQLYLEEFSVPEIDAIIAWRTSDLGKKYTDFSIKKTNPIIIKHAKDLFEYIMMEEMEKVSDMKWEEEMEENKLKDHAYLNDNIKVQEMEDKVWTAEDLEEAINERKVLSPISEGTVTKTEVKRAVETLTKETLKHKH